MRFKVMCIEDVVDSDSDNTILFRKGKEYYLSLEEDGEGLYFTINSELDLLIELPYDELKNKFVSKYI